MQRFGQIDAADTHASMLVYLEFGTALPYNGGALIYVCNGKEPFLIAADSMCSLTRLFILLGFWPL